MSTFPAERTAIITGAFAIAFLFRDHPELIIGARRGAPLTVG